MDICVSSRKSGRQIASDDVKRHIRAGLSSVHGYTGSIEVQSIYGTLLSPALCLSLSIFCRTWNVIKNPSSLVQRGQVWPVAWSLCRPTRVIWVCGVNDLLLDMMQPIGVEILFWERNWTDFDVWRFIGDSCTAVMTAIETNEQSFFTCIALILQTLQLTGRIT